MYLSSLTLVTASFHSWMGQSCDQKYRMIQCSESHTSRIRNNILVVLVNTNSYGLLLLEGLRADILSSQLVFLILQPTFSILVLTLSDKQLTVISRIGGKMETLWFFWLWSFESFFYSSLTMEFQSVHMRLDLA